MQNINYIALRLWSMLKKEFIQIRRDYATYIFLIFVPFCEVILFGYIINTDSKHLPTIIVSHDHSNFSNSLIQGLRNTEYFDVYSITDNDRLANTLIDKGKTQFIINIPGNFYRDIIKEKHPHILIEGDATDPVAIGNAFHAASVISKDVLDRDMQGSLSYLLVQKPAFVVDTHALFNPAMRAQYHTVPGLLVTILTVSLVMLTAISITSEFEHGTMEVLLITPLKPLEVILGKIIPHIVLGYILLFLTIGLCYWVYRVPFYGSLLLLVVCAIPFIIANLGIGLAVSTISRTQFQAVNVANVYMLPAILLSGFMFPFYAMPTWAQWIGETLPTTHFLRIVLGIMLKNATFIDVWPDIWPMLIFIVFIIRISLRRYRHTLD